MGFIVIKGCHYNCTWPVPSEEPHSVLYDENGIDVCLKLEAKLHCSICGDLAKGIESRFWTIPDYILIVTKQCMKWIVISSPLDFKKHFSQSRIRLHIVVCGEWVYRDVRFYKKWEFWPHIRIDILGWIDKFEVINVVPWCHDLKSNNSCDLWEKYREEFEKLTKGSYKSSSCVMLMADL